MTPETIALIVSVTHWLVGASLFGATVAFITLFLVPGLRLGRELETSAVALAKVKKAGPVTDLEVVGQQAMGSSDLQHAWSEYRDTLHGQRLMSSTGELKVSRWRATATANTFFTEGALVDTRLRTEFFKHLPGILTGLGIIGTFSGLIFGLKGFQVSEDASIVTCPLLPYQRFGRSPG